MARTPEVGNIVKVTGEGAGKEFKDCFGYVTEVDDYVCVVTFAKLTKGYISDNLRIYALSDVTVVCYPITGEPI